MRFGSVCSGIEAASVAWHPLGWKAAWLSEIEPFPSAVLAHHYPDVPNLGDMTTLPERILSGEVEAPDLFCGGTPCQAFSVAGLRNSLDDARGNLSLTFVGIANAIDHVRSVRRDDPAIIFWENVPGVLSTKDNAFGCFLGALAGEVEALEPPGGKWTNAGCVSGPQRTVAWRTLDAQYFGVAQRRRRVFVVASARADFNPAEVLFEFDGLRRDSAPSREARKEVTECAASGLDVSHTGTLTAGFGKLGAPEIDAYTAIPVVSPFLETQPFGGMSPVAGTLTANTGGMTRPAGNANELDFCVPVGVEIGPSGGKFTDLNPTLDTRAKDGPIRNQLAGAVMTMAHGQGGAEIATDRAPTLTCNHEAPIAFHPTQEPINSTEVCHSISANSNATAAVAQPMPINTMVALRHEALGRGTGFGIGEAGDPAYTLTKGHTHAVAQPIGWSEELTASVDLAGTIQRGGDGGRHDGVMTPAMAVRRLTPVECERLQGFPDGYTQIAWRKKPVSECPDGPRYKALGNSWAVPVVAWIGRRIAKEVAK